MEFEDKVEYSCRIFDVVTRKDKDGMIGFDPTCIRSNDWVTIIVEKDGKFLMEKQLRYGKMKEYMEFPCGIVETSEKPISAAKRELEEETGYQVSENDIHCLGKCSPNPAFMTNYMHYFYINLDYAKFSVGKQNLDEHEKLEYFWRNKYHVENEMIASEGSALMGMAFLLLKRMYENNCCNRL